MEIFRKPNFWKIIMIIIMDRQQLESWVDWFKVSLATSVRVKNSDQEGAAFAPQSSLDTLLQADRPAQ